MRKNRQSNGHTSNFYNPKTPGIFRFMFDDLTPPTGLRYCINGVVLDFEKAKEAEKKFNEKEKPQ